MGFFTMDGGGGGHHHHHHGGGHYWRGGGGWGPWYAPPTTYVVEVPCPATYDPVLGSDGRFYDNACQANRAGATVVRKAHISRTGALSEDLGAHRGGWWDPSWWPGSHRRIRRRHRAVEGADLGDVDGWTSSPWTWGVAGALLGGGAVYFGLGHFFRR